MDRIKIQNVGPISNVDFELNKVNVIIGPQSSGKSTIAKIISYCQWVEKRYLLDGEYKEDVHKQLLDFHHLDENYFDKKSNFEYESDFIKISYKGKRLEENISINESKILDYRKTKNIYIPAERNFVAVVPNLSKYNETNDNIMSLIYDWYKAKNSFTSQNSLPILNFGINYYYQKGADLDMLTMSNTPKEIPLKTGSSGLQSLTPLIVIIHEYMTANISCKKNAIAVKEQDYLMKLKEKYIIPDILEYAKIVENRSYYAYVNMIIEEPEQNLFPETQKELIYYILNKISSVKEHSLLITTHSPYILYAINNCIMGAVISNKIEDEKNEFESKDSWILPDKVNIFEIDETNGTIRSIKNLKTGTVDKHYFNRISNKIMDEYYNMLNFFSNEK